MVVKPAAEVPQAPKGLQTVVVHAAGPEADGVVVNHWKLMWVEAGMDTGNFVADFEQQTLKFIEEARRCLDYQTFVALDGAGEVVGSASCQAWSGPIPMVVKPTSFKLGSVWAVYVKPTHRRQKIATCLMQSVKQYWRQIGCLHGVLLHASRGGRAVYERVGFKAGNLLLVDLSQASLDARLGMRSEANDFLVEAAGPEADKVVVKNWQQMWLEAGVAETELKPDLPKITTSFIEIARDKLQYQTFIARNKSGCIIGSASCQTWHGPLPLVLTESVFKFGTVWGVYVEPIYRRKGVATSLMEHCMDHWRSIGCQKGILLYASEGGRQVCERLGFQPFNGMVIDLKDGDISYLKAISSTPRPETLEVRPSLAHDLGRATISALRCAGVAGDDEWLTILASALPQQLNAAFSEEDPANQHLRRSVMGVQKAYGLYVDPNDNWFTRNVKRFGGGFDMKQLTSQPGLLASKFDRLSSNYGHWVVGNQSQVEYWLSRCARKHASVFGGKSTRMLDVACGIGLPGHQLRLCGFQGHLVGTDISEGMIKQARQRGAHNMLFVANANEGLPEILSSSIDLVLCTGALELLDHEAVLSAFSRILRVGGQAWISFQLEKDPVAAAEISERHPTAHQNVRGLTRNEIEEKLAAARLVTDEAECCEEAFYTPSPDQDGSLLPVPYLFLTVQKHA